MKKKTKIILIAASIILILLFVLVIPYIKFNSIEKKVLESGKRYYEINSSHLPTGNKIKEIDLKTLYVKDFLDEDLKVEITDRKCSLDNSWIKVKKVNNKYKYYVYLECGIFKSNIDYKGPIITLNGKDEITLYLDEKYKESGVKSVVDNRDGNIDVKEVIIDSSTVDSTKAGTYEVKYKVKDSFNNETIKIRKVIVTETLNHIVEKNTGKEKLYKGNQHNNYLKLDGILFKIIGINDDNSVKVATDGAISAISYNKSEEWLNEYFYEKLSDSAKKYIKEDSKWCIDTVKNTTKSQKCNTYSKKNPVGLLSINDINNSKDNNGNYNLEQISLVYNLKNKKTSYFFGNGKYTEIPTNENATVVPVMNIIENALITKGDGTITNPYQLKGNTKKLKPGDKVSDAKVGSYLIYSGYKFRVISKEKDKTTKIIMNEVIQKNNEDYNVKFSNESIVFDPTKKQNIGYTLTNDISNYLKTDIFSNKKVNYQVYKEKIEYNNSNESKEYKLKTNLPSMYDLFSTTLNKDYWFKEYSANNYCYMEYYGQVNCSKYNYNDKKGIRVVAYLNKNVTIESGEGSASDPYSIVK